MKTIVSNIEIPLYKATINVVINKTVYKALKTVECVEDDKEYYDGANAMHVHKENSYQILAFSTKAVTHGIIAHECLHATFELAHRKGLLYCPQSEEAFAYLLNFMVDRVTEIFKINEIEIK